MSEPESRYLETLKTKAEKILREVQEMQRALGIEGEDISDEARERLGDEQLENLEKVYSLRVDGHFDIRVSEDEMSCVANFYPPSPGGEPVSLEKVQERLNELGVTLGVDWDGVGNALLTCNLERKELWDVPVAKGIPPEAEVPAHYQIEKNFLEPKVSVDLNAERVDFRSFSHLVVVKKGDLLARKVEKRPGKIGWNIRGKELAYPVEKVPVYAAGKNTEEREDGIYALCDGAFKLQEGTIQVEPILYVTGDVDYHTGNIEFPGDLVVEGSILDGFTVKVLGNILCKGTIYAANVYCKGNLHVWGGIIGKGKSKVIVEGEARVKFLESCYLEAKGNVFSEVGALHSVVYSKGEFRTGKKGLVVGGKITAQEGITAANVGTETSPKAELILGNDYQVQRKLECIRDKSIELSQRLKEVSQALSKQPEHPDLLRVKETLLGNIRQLNEWAQKLIPYLTIREQARLVVLDRIIAGNYVEICNVSYIVPRPMKHVSFFLNRRMGRIEGEACKSS